jgi:hypothetical protein
MESKKGKKCEKSNEYSQIIMAKKLWELAPLED